MRRTSHDKTPGRCTRCLYSINRFHSVTTRGFLNYIYLLNDHLKPESFLKSFFHNSVLFQYIYYYYNITVKLQKSDNNKKTKNLLYTLSITSTTYTVKGFIHLTLHILEEISELPKTAPQLLKVACLKNDVN